MDMITAVLLKFLLFLDPTIQVVPVSMVCVPVESSESMERVDEFHRKNMGDLGKPSSGIVVDPWGTLSDSQREALERKGAN